MLINKKQVTILVRNNCKVIGKDGMDALDRKVNSIILSAIALTKDNKKVTPVEINMAKEKGATNETVTPAV